MNKKVIAVFGGSFNPPVNSHINLAKQIIEEYRIIEKILFVPVSTKYRKMNLIEDEHRYNMLKLICKNEDMLDVSDIELKQNKQLFTIQTLDLLKKQYKEYDIWFIMGTDNLKELDTWSKSDELLKKYKIMVLERDSDNANEIILNNKLLNENRDSIMIFKDIKKINLSSTIIRKKISTGENIDEFVPKCVLDYIAKNNLYK